MGRHDSGDLVLDETVILKLIIKIRRQRVGCISLADDMVHIRALVNLRVP
jgi:hypothetical protein